MMALNNFRDPFLMPPANRSLQNFYDDAIPGFLAPFGTRPYWSDQPMLEHCNIGNAIGKIVNNEEKFAVEVDVSQFKPRELSVNLENQDLIIEGRHQERIDEFGTIERHFIRKYHIPDDACLEGVHSELNEAGILSVTAPKKTVETCRRIPIIPTSKQAAKGKRKKQ